MPEPSGVEVTRLLHRWTLGDRKALESLMPLVYAELRRLARRSIGAEQSGHIYEVGFDLYCELLEEAVKEIRGEKVAPSREVEIDLRTP